MVTPGGESAGARSRADESGARSAGADAGGDEGAISRTLDAATGEETGGAEGSHAAEALLPLVYEQLRATAKRQLDAESPAHTLQPTALVHEAYLRLAGPRHRPWRNRAHFYAAAAQAMRRILIDHARARRARGGRPVALSELHDVSDLARATPEQVIAFDEALVRLESTDDDAAAVLRLRFFAGLSPDEAAEALGISARTCARLWAFARARMFRALGVEESRDAR